jgi:beta-1,4-mannosyl-glycoprotein beta-1,4-N-acetylglucosaminyltransferase
VIDKIEAFAHQELNLEKNKEQTRIANCINLGLDPFDRADCTWAFFPVDAYPPKLADLMRRNPKLIKAHLI